MGTHSKTLLAETSIKDDTVPGLTWVISVVPDTDCTDGMDMYEGYGSLWQWAIVTVTPVIDGHFYAGAHGSTIGWGHMRNGKGFMTRETIEELTTGSRWYAYDHDVQGVQRAQSDRYEDIPPIVPVLIEQASDALPDVIMSHVREAVAVADLIRMPLGEAVAVAEAPDAPGSRRGGPHHGRVVITITANVPYETAEPELINIIEDALDGGRTVLENVDVRCIEDARTVYDA